MGALRKDAVARWAGKTYGTDWKSAVPGAAALALMLIAPVAGPALAQDRPKPLKTITIHEPAPGASNLYVIDGDGTVRIDWRAVETLAALKSDGAALPIAQLMLAIRDGTWKPAR
jgi:hypothetical protein